MLGRAGTVMLRSTFGNVLIRGGGTVLGTHSREALCCIPGSAGRDLEGGSWVEWLTWIRKVKGTRACQKPGGRAQWSGTARWGDPRDMAKAGLPEA
jgi:hypothetical protein